jgi:superfamily II DNA or RNA helicase
MQFEIPTERQQNGTPSITLREYQREAQAAVLEAIRERNVARPLITLPTGMGKTVVFSSVAKELGYPVLVIAHRDELLDQAADKFRQIDPGVSVGKVKAESNQWFAEVVTASIQTLSRGARFEQFEAILRERPFKLAIVDEAHHAPADTYRKVMGALHHAGVPILGVTATAERGDGSGLDGLFDELVYQKDMLWGMENGYLCDLRGVQVKLKAEFGRIKVSRGDFQDGAAAKVLHDSGAPHYALKAYLEHAKDRKALIFTPTVELAHEMAEVFQEGGVAAEALDGGTPHNERKAILARLKSGATRVVANAAVLTEGFDEPTLDCIIVARPTLSRPLYVQMVGRGTRTFPGKQDCMVIDLVGLTDRVRLVTVPNLFGVSTKHMRDGMTVAQALQAQVAEAAKGPVKLREIESISVDLFTQRKFNWIKTRSHGGRTERFVLSTGDGFVSVVAENMDQTKWCVLHEPRKGDPKILATDLDLGYAQGTAEDYVKKQGAEYLSTRNAGWRSNAASGPQIDALVKWKVPLRVETKDGRRVAFTDGEEPLTKGQASDLLTEVIAAKKARAAS